MKSLLQITALLIASVCFNMTAFAVTPQASAAVSIGVPVDNNNPALTASVLDKAKQVMTDIFSSMELAAATDKPGLSDNMKLALPSTESKLQPDDTQPSTNTPAEPAPVTSPLDNMTPVNSATSKQEAAKPAATESKDALIPVGRIVWLKGTVKAEHKSKGTRDLTKQSIVFVGDVLVTGGKTEAEIAFTDNTLLTLGANTRFAIKEYAYHPEKKDEKGSVGKFVMELIAGGFRTITGLIPKGDPEDYKVETPVATIGVRGTDYTAFVRDAKKLKEKPLLVMEQLKGLPVVNIPNKAPIVLSDNTRYVTVEADGSFVLSNERPPILGAPLPIIPAKLEPITLKEIENTFTAASTGEWCIVQDTSGGGNN